MWSLDEVLTVAARKYGAKEALVTANRRVTFAELDAAVTRFAHHLRAQGVKPGDKVAVFGRNSISWAVGFLATLRLGGVTVPLNHKLAPPELAFIVGHSESRIVLADADLAASVPASTRETSRVLLLGGDDTLDGVTLFGGDAPAPLPRVASSGDVAEILYTSGTTGLPKGCLHSHANVLFAGMASSLAYGLDSTDRVLLAMPVWHSFPLNNLLLGSLYVGATVVMMPEYHPLEMLETIQRERCTLFFGAPVAFLLPLRTVPDFERYDLTSVRTWLYGGGPIDADTSRLLAKRYRTERFFQIFGMTETGPTGTLLRPEEQVAKAGSIGRYGVSGCDVKVMRDPTTEAKPGEVGEIWMRCQSMMLGYYRDPEATAAAFHDGWYRTGDVARIDEDGYLFIVDRIKDMIITGGENVYSKEVEDALASHPDLAESAVIGIPHKDWGETVAAILVLKKGATFDEASFQAHCESRLARYKSPRIYHVVESLPRTPSGKVIKVELRKKYAARA
ncbi:AMP-binding protein [Pyxidicoccus fallax]|uniref:Long-chain fatty acid--CoA ligase n=1 Tax=Pyxidicoccus fallax TaxID=394095 RepID=A0A848LGK9_9BACT|nr:AMP-binding protein [Pyxidicoccus fallax]NMO15821.1 long-chain fatty acid--CoA ligase [Pyxidicoccus fallax]NPC79394.1 AMP-binding protein [Pyxidicoccus fallax]